MNLPSMSNQTFIFTFIVQRNRLAYAGKLGRGREEECERERERE